VNTAADVPAVYVTAKLQVLPEPVAGYVNGPAAVGVPLAVSVTVVAPAAAKLPLPENVTPFTAVVLIE
jgi:hypothetical protein